VIVYYLHLVKIHLMLFIGQQLNHVVNIVLENYFFGLLLLLFIVVSKIRNRVQYNYLLFLVIHAILVLLQAITLNVAFNSQNKMLLIIMITNNVNFFFDSLFDK